MADASSATLRLASTHALSFTFLPSWLRSLESCTTVGPVQLVSDVLQQCETQMLQGRVQFVLSHWHELVPSRLDPALHRSIQVGSDRLLPVSAPARDGGPRHRLPAAGRNTGEARVPILSYSAESGIGRVVRALRGAALEQAHAEPVFTAHLASVLKTMALDGRGVAWLPDSLIRDELDAGRLVQAGGSDWAVAVEIRLFRGHATLPRAAEALWAAAAASARPSPRARRSC